MPKLGWLEPAGELGWWPARIYLRREGLVKVVRALSVCLFFLSIVTAANALNPDRDIHQLAHRSWTEKEGYPGRAEALAQTTDGFLWIGTDDGLFRFDGVHFERYLPVSGDRLPDGPVRGMRALPDGSLWISYRLDYKICVLRKGNAKCYGKAEGVTSNPTTIVQDHAGTMWANTEAGIIRLNGMRWERIGKDWDFPEEVPNLTSDALFVDSHGTLWVGVNHTVLYLPMGSHRFRPTGAFAGWSTSIAEAPDGRIWLSDIESYVRAISTSVGTRSAAIAECEVRTSRETLRKCPSDNHFVIKTTSAVHLLFDRNGALWVATDTAGVARIPHPELLSDWPHLEAHNGLQRFSSKDGLSADTVTPILEDREGNIWVASRDGLDQFRDTALVPVGLRSGMYRVAMAPADHGDIFVVGSWAYFGRIHGDHSDASWIPTDAFKLYRDFNGTLWLMGSFLGQWKNGNIRRVTGSPYGSGGGGPGMWQVASDRSGALWAFSNGHGFSLLDHDRWKAWATPPAIARQRIVNMFSDSTGRVWVATYEGGIIKMDGGAIVDISVQRDKPKGFIKAFAEHAPDEIWAGGASGLLMIDRGNIRMVKAAGGETSEDITGIVDAGNDGLWLNSALGILHVARREIDLALRDESYRFHTERFDSYDGVPGFFESIYPYPKAIRGADGRIWFSASRGVAWIDPKTILPRNRLPPPVSITSVSADNSLHWQLADLRFPAHTANIRIDYAALSLSVPEHVRFRYQLEGLDRGWQDADTRRQAYYTNLGPGTFQFRVIACNNDGVWNEIGASLRFSIAPAYYQTTWFHLLCLAAVLFILWALYQLRLQQLRHQFTIGLEARVNERTRVARELHDTLLQSFQGAVFQFQAARSLFLRNADNTLQVIDEAIQAAEEGITEGRTAIRDLRPEPAAQRDLPELLEAAGRELADAHQLNGKAPYLGVIVEGKQRNLSLICQDEVYRISREVIRNAFTHADASHIEVEIRYDLDQLRVRIRDDGRGIGPKILEEGGRSGHWGISGMRERAQEIGAHLEFWSEVGAGTEVELTVPASMAYPKSASERRLRMFSPGR